MVCRVSCFLEIFYIHALYWSCNMRAYFFMYQVRRGFINEVADLD